MCILDIIPISVVLQLNNSIKLYNSLSIYFATSHFVIPSYASYMGHTVSSLPTEPPLANPAPAANESTPAALVTGGPPPGLCESALKRVTGENPPSPDDLEKVRENPYFAVALVLFYCLILVFSI